MSHKGNDLCNDSLENLASDKELQSEVLVEEQKEKLDLYKKIVTENEDVHEREREREEYEAQQHDLYYAPSEGYNQ